MYIDDLLKDAPPIIKDRTTISKINKASSIALNALSYSSMLLMAGTRANILDKQIAQYIIEQGGSPANYEIAGYGYATSISVESEIAHGLPKPLKLLKHSDVVCIDIGVKYKDVYADFAKTFVVGGTSKADEDALTLIRTCDNALKKSIRILRLGGMLSDYGKTVDKIVKENGFKIIKFLTGHGVGEKYHERPYIYNFYHPENDIVLKEGMVFAFELMITNGSDKYRKHEDGWTLYTYDGSIAVHFEYTVAMLKSGPKILGMM